MDIVVSCCPPSVMTVVCSFTKVAGWRMVRYYPAVAYYINSGSDPSLFNPVVKPDDRCGKALHFYAVLGTDMRWQGKPKIKPGQFLNYKTIVSLVLDHRAYWLLLSNRN